MALDLLLFRHGVMLANKHNMPLSISGLDVVLLLVPFFNLTLGKLVRRKPLSVDRTHDPNQYISKT